jgi:hypothetical protein
MLELGARAEEAPPLQVVWEGAAARAAKEPAREALGSLGTIGRREDLLIPIVPKLEQISDTMQVTSLKNPVKVHVLLVLHILNIHILLLDHWRWLQMKHSLRPILMIESPESLISAPLLDQVVASLVAEMHHIQGILLAVVHNLPCGVNLQRIHLEALHLIGSTTMTWRDLGGGLLLVAAGSWSLGKLLALGIGTTGGSTDILMMLRVTLITTSHCLRRERTT